MLDENVCEGNGTIIQKSEAITKKGDKYWKFNIEVEGKGKTYSLFEYEAGTKVSVGDQVKIFWTEKEGTFNNRPITYRNLNSICREEIEVEEIVDDSKQEQPRATPTTPKKDMGTVNNFKAAEADKYEIQRSQRQAMEIITAIAATYTEASNAKEYVKTAIIDNYKSLSIQLFNINKEIRKQALGY